MKTRSIPKNTGGTVHLATKAFNGALSTGIEVALKQNDAPKLAEKLHDLIGEPGAGTTGGKQGILNETRAAVKDAQIARKKAMADGLTFCGTAVDLLKGHLGRRWNAKWAAAGFSRGSLALPQDPLPLLLELRGYFRTHPDHENAKPLVTAALAESLATAIRNADKAVGDARSERITARKQRDEALATLRRTLTGLRTELDQLLSPDDERWLKFGFSRPIDGTIPGVVEGLVLRPGAAHEVVAEWNRATGADNYRVTRMVRGLDTAPIEVGLFADLGAVIRGLPSGATVDVYVTARNQAGETASTIATIVVP